MKPEISDERLLAWERAIVKADEWNDREFAALLRVTAARLREKLEQDSG